MPLRRLLAVAAFLAVAALAIGFFFRNRTKENVLRTSGTIEATEVDVSFQIAGRVAEVLAEEGQMVRRGDLVARMDDEELVQRTSQIQAALDAVVNLSRQQEAVVAFRRTLVEVQITQARSEADALRAASARIREGLRPQEIRVAQAEVAQMDAQLVQRRADFERVSQLLPEGAVTRQQVDVAEAALRTAETNRDAARERLSLAQEGSRSQDIIAAEARVAGAQAAVGVAEAGRKEVDVQLAALDAAQSREKELRAQLEAARTQLGYTRILAPTDGVVLTKNVESGEVVNSGTPVVTIADVSKLWMNVYIPETQTGLVNLGQTVRVRVDSFPNEAFESKLTFISSESEFTPKTIITQEERVKLVYRVKLSMENPQQRLKPGMPADAEFMLGNTLAPPVARVVAPPAPAAQQPALQQPALQPPAPQPSPQQPAVLQPAVQQPAVLQPAAQQPAVSQPAAQPLSPPPPALPSPPVYAVQVGAFGNRSNADALVAELSKKYSTVFIEEIVGSPTPDHVRIGRFPDLQAARQLWRELKNDGISSFVVSWRP